MRGSTDFFSMRNYYYGFTVRYEWFMLAPEEASLEFIGRRRRPRKKMAVELIAVRS